MGLSRLHASRCIAVAIMFLLEAIYASVPVDLISAGVSLTPGWVWPLLRQSHSSAGLSDGISADLTDWPQPGITPGE
jgi:hypothetical protein